MVKQRQALSTLTEIQARAVGLLLAGQTGREVAEACGVAEETVSRWKHEDAFALALGRAKAELWESELERLRGLLGKCIDIVAAELDGPNKYRAAVEVLRVLGVHGGVGKPTGPTTTMDLAMRQMLEF